MFLGPGWFTGYSGALLLAGGLISLLSGADDTMSFAMIGGGAGLLLAGVIIHVVSERTHHSRAARRTLREGEDGTAEVLSCSAGPVGKRGVVPVELTLRVRKPGRSLPLEVTHSTSVTQATLARLRPGQTVPVKIDPLNPKRVEIVLERLPG